MKKSKAIATLSHYLRGKTPEKVLKEINELVKKMQTPESKAAARRLFTDKDPFKK